MSEPLSKTQFFSRCELERFQLLLRSTSRHSTFQEICALQLPPSSQTPKWNSKGHLDALPTVQLPVSAGMSSPQPVLILCFLFLILSNTQLPLLRFLSSQGWQSLLPIAKIKLSTFQTTYKVMELHILHENSTSKSIIINEDMMLMTI